MAYGEFFRDGKSLREIMTHDSCIVSKAHDWVQSLPLSENRLVCTRCGAYTKIGDFEIPRCKEHNESISSGFIDEG